MEMQPRRTGIAVAMLFVAAIAIISHHPVAQGVSDVERLNSVVDQSGAAQAVHGAVMAIWLILGAAMIGFSRLLGISRPTVLIALAAFMVSVVMGFIAMTFDGFVISAIGQTCISARPDCVTSTTLMFGFAAIAVQAFTKIALFLVAGAMALWSIAMINRDRQWRIIACIGIASASAQVALLFGPAAHLTPQTLILVLFAQCCWFFGLVWLVGFRKSALGS